MKTKLIIIAIVLFAGILPLQAQQSEPSEDYFNHGLGLSASFTSGYGLSYRYFFNDKISLQPTAFYYYSKEDNRKNSGLNVGIEYQHGLFRTEEARFYVYAGYSYHRYYNDDSWYSDDPWNDYQSTNEDLMHFFGTGIGYDYIFNKHFSVGLNTGFRYGSTKEYYNYPNRPMENTTNEKISFSFSGAINFFFMF